MNILVACEESQRVTMEFRKLASPEQWLNSGDKYKELKRRLEDENH